MLQFNKKPKLGGDQFSSNFQKRIESIIEEQFLSFNQTNEEKRKHFMVSNRLILFRFCGFYDDFSIIFNMNIYIRKKLTFTMSSSTAE